MKAAAIIVAGGSGSRMKSDIPKQFLLLNGRPILMHTLEQFHRFDSTMQLILVLPDAEIERWKMLCSEFHFQVAHTTVSGGQTRFHSVMNGLSMVEDASVVGVHDGVRPLVALEVIARCYTAAAAGDAAVPVVPAVDSLRMISGNGSIALDRSTVRMVQTPQVFPAGMLKEAYRQEYNPLFTDDASVVEAAGGFITLVEGNVENIKITNPLDLDVAERLLNIL